MTLAILIWVGLLDTLGFAFALYGLFTAKNWGEKWLK